ncbi:MAG TPA: hypothetical protein VI386_27430 [Candidatus Sulfotelmatobacter sp.]
MSSCATIGPPQPPSLELPKPPTDLRAVREGNKVVLSWTRPTGTTDRQRLRGQVQVRICRTLETSMNNCGTLVGQLTGGAILAGAEVPKREAPEARISDSFTDLLRTEAPAHNAGSMTYAVEVVNATGRSAGLSNRVQVPLAATLFPPRDFRAKVSGEGVILNWTGDLPPANTEGVHYFYRVYRRLEGSRQPVSIGELPASEERQMSFTDSNIEWERTYFYRAKAVTVIEVRGKPDLQIAGDDTAEVKVVAHDVFPPAIPSGLQAVFSGPGRDRFIDLIWAPGTEADLAGYNVYRREGNSTLVRVNAELVKVPAYRDGTVSAGKTYFYSVSAVDVRGNESGKSEEAKENVPGG